MIGRARCSEREHWLLGSRTVGEHEPSPGTHTLQSERFYQALQAFGVPSRLVLLPHESHGYRARESVLHTLYEMLDWAERHTQK